MKHALLPLLALLAPACSTPSHPKGPLTEFEFLAGTWAEVRSDAVYEEQWTLSDGWSLRGTGRVVADGKTVFVEKIAIEPRGKGFAYVAEIPGAAPVEFRLVERGEQWLRFENPSHDFPQRIEYRRDGKSLHAEISGTTPEGERSQSWDMRRVSGK